MSNNKLSGLVLLSLFVAWQIPNAGSQEAQMRSGIKDGFRVHGHWTIDVHNPNGKLAAHTEFENSLANGKFTLGPVLGRAATVGVWNIGAFFTNATGPCLFNNLPVECYITETTNTLAQGQNVFRNLTVSAPFQNSPGGGTLTLTGTFTVQNSGPITAVASGVFSCSPTVAPANCPPVSTEGSGSSFFSDAQGIGPINVTVGQLVQLTVVFSFS